MKGCHLHFVRIEYKETFVRIQDEMCMYINYTYIYCRPGSQEMLMHRWNFIKCNSDQINFILMHYGETGTHPWAVAELRMLQKFVNYNFYIFWQDYIMQKNLWSVTYKEIIKKDACKSFQNTSLVLWNSKCFCYHFIKNTAFSFIKNLRLFLVVTYITNL